MTITAERISLALPCSLFIGPCVVVGDHGLDDGDAVLSRTATSIITQYNNKNVGDQDHTYAAGKLVVCPARRMMVALQIDL